MQKTQIKRLMEYLAKHGRITPMQAWESLGIYRLSDQVFKLRKKNWNIVTVPTKVYNKFKEPCMVATYVLDPSERAKMDDAVTGQISLI